MSRFNIYLYVKYIYVYIYVYMPMIFIDLSLTPTGPWGISPKSPKVLGEKVWGSGPTLVFLRSNAIPWIQIFDHWYDPLIQNETCFYVIRIFSKMLFLGAMKI